MRKRMIQIQAQFNVIFDDPIIGMSLKKEASSWKLYES
jgi:hypothetical protein